MQPPLRVSVLGPLELRDASGQQVPVGGARLRAFVIRLAIADGTAIPADRLAEDLWDGDHAAGSANAVQALASRLRAAAGRDLLEFGPGGYRLTLGHEQVDAEVFERLVAAGRLELAGGDLTAAAATLRTADQMWRGPALAEVADAAFAAPVIARLSELRLAAAEDRIDAELGLGRGAGLVPEIGQLSAEHPLRERLRGQLMTALYAAGRQADALAVYEDTRQQLATALGIDPSPGLAAIHLAVLRGELPPGPVPALSGRAADSGDPGAGPVRVARPVPDDGRATEPSARPDNLPAQLTSFVGRDDELSRLAKLLSECRLVTLTGPGGAGKTRLAVEAASRLAPPDGVWFVPLAPVSDAADVAQAVLTAVGGQDVHWRADALDAARLASLSTAERLSEMLARRELVLVLDNCEHLVESVAATAARLLAAAPAVRILATSREPLSVTGETLAPVPSLPLPPDGAGTAELAGSPALRLFADRAAAVQPAFAVTEENAVTIARICAALDGVPLAIELAAARIRTLTPAQIAARLDDRFALLSVTSRGTLPRHQTLRAVVDWSWDLLDESERMILRRLSVFSGGATPASAQQVCCPDGDRDVVEVIASLLDKSLVVADWSGQQVRYSLLETVRAYAADRLTEAGDEDQTAAAHARYFLELAEQAEPELRARDQLRWLRLLTAEHDNFAAALRYLAAAGDGASVLRLVSALTWFWITHDYDSELREWAETATRLAPADVDADLAGPYAVCRIVTLMGGLATDGLPAPDLQAALREVPVLTNDNPHPLLALATPMLAALMGSGESIRASLASAPTHPDPWTQAARLLITGHIAVNDGDIDGAEADLTAGRTAFEQIGDRFGFMICLSGLAEVAMARDAPAQAVRLLEQARALSVEGMARNWSHTARVPLGRARAAAGDIAGGRADIAEAVRAAERLGELDDAALGLIYLSDLARKDRDLPAADDLLTEAAELVRTTLARPDLAMVAALVQSKLGCVAEQRGELDAAAGLHRAALAELRESVPGIMLSNQMLAIVVEGVAALKAGAGAHERAATLLGLAHSLQGHPSHGSLEAGRVRSASSLTPAGFELAYARGRSLGQADALALADEL